MSDSSSAPAGRVKVYARKCSFCYGSGRETHGRCIYCSGAGRRTGIVEVDADKAEDLAKRLDGYIIGQEEKK